MNHKDVIKRLLKFVMHSRIYLWISFVSAILSVLLSLYAPIVIGNAIDAISYQKRISAAFSHITLLICIYVAYSFFNWCMMITSNKIAFSSSCMLRKMLFHKLEHVAISFYDTHARGDIISRYINDIDIISDGLLQGLSTIINGVVTIIAAIAFMLHINWQMSLVVMLSAPFTYFVAKTITRRSQKYFKEQSTALGKLNGYSEEMLSQIKTVKAYHYEDHANQTFHTINDKLYQSGVKSQFYGSLANPSTRFVTNIAYAFVGMAGAMLALFNTITVGNISTFLIYSNLFSKPFNEITGVITQLQSAIASGRRIFTLLDMEEESDDKNLADYHQALGDVEFKNVCFAYEDAKPLMKHLNIKINAGSKIAIVGRSGAGKTTLVNLLMRFYDIQEGCILLDGKDIKTMTRNSLRQNFGMVLQDTYLFEDSIAANIAYGKPNSTRDDIILAAKKTGAHDFIRHLSQGYDTQLHTNSNSLSQGQRQLLSITRVLLMNPAILILDEATSSIDTRSEQHVNNAMEQLMEGKTSFVIAHRLSTIVHADLILVMDHGDIVEHGNHVELLCKKGYYAQLYNSQFS